MDNAASLLSYHHVWCFYELLLADKISYFFSGSYLQSAIYNPIKFRQPFGVRLRGMMFLQR